MTAYSRFASVAAAGALLVAVSAPAPAASVLTEAFVANVRPNVDFLDRSSRLALDKSTNTRIRAFAHSEAVEQTIVANAIVAWTQTSTEQGATDALGTAERNAAVTPDAVAPLDAAAAATTDLVTGRSVASDHPITVTPIPRESMLPAGADNLDRLSSLKGQAFDALYRNTQRDSLNQLATVYSDYIAKGEDPGLRALAIRELPKINRRLAELRHL